MELPRREPGDEFVAPGRYREIEQGLCQRRTLEDTAALFVYAFDFRTRVGPFVFFDKMLIPGAPLSMGAALRSAGLEKVRLVLQQWSPNIRPSQARIDGKPPELLMISSMQIHSAAAYELVRDARRMGDQRPLILVGGAKAIYQPWDFFDLAGNGGAEPDVAVTGEEFVVLELLDLLAEHRGPGETLRDAFQRVRREGLLEQIPGLVYRDSDEDSPPDELVHTGIQRLVQNLDELPSVTRSLDLFEPAHRRPTLARNAMSPRQLGRRAKVASLVTTHGCKFRCSYCPIPGYNQFTFRHKSPERLADDMRSLHDQTRINLFFGTDDNLFNNRDSIEDILTTLAKTEYRGRPLSESVSWATEATEFDVWKNRDLLPLAREAGLRLIWFGVEDMTAELVKKGQSPEKTESLFREMISHGIGPMPMMMHHDGQPLWSRGSLYGLLNQTRFLRKSGAFSFQVTFLTPSVGSKGFEQPYQDSMVFERIGGRPIEDRHFDGNHCIATHDERPWRKQLNMMLAYAAFYNPLGLLRDIFRFDDLWSFRLIHHSLGCLRTVRSLPRELAWIRTLRRGPLERSTAAPQPPVRFRFPAHVHPSLVHYELADTPARPVPRTELEIIEV
ncbi:MAG: radical SAM protein [Planctomycetota bacterium]|nr:MAG: radical SAM protein [Planctomycetota bacterium]REK31377.1 MAG: radical SAM protein [Planctomycetota bacterium]REK39100.1 MAG: radical SAM protein [Planctomycetota bacterium]